MKTLLILALAVLLTACGPRRAALPVDAQCTAVALQPCTPGGSTTDTGVRWTSDPNDPQAFDALASKVSPSLAAALLTCEVKRAALQACLERLEKAKRITLPKPEPSR